MAAAVMASILAMGIPSASAIPSATATLSRLPSTPHTISSRTACCRRARQEATATRMRSPDAACRSTARRPHHPIFTAAHRLPSVISSHTRRRSKTATHQYPSSKATGPQPTGSRRSRRHGMPCRLLPRRYTRASTRSKERMRSDGSARLYSPTSLSCLQMRPLPPKLLGAFRTRIITLHAARPPRHSRRRSSRQHRSRSSPRARFNSRCCQKRVRRALTLILPRGRRRRR